MNLAGEFSKGIWRENAVFRLLLGLCPVLGVTTTMENGIGMGLATTFVLLGSNLLVSMLRNIIPAKVRIACFIIIIATFVTIVQLSMEAWFYGLYEALGIFIPLIVTNCAIVARAEIFASRNTIGASIADGLGMGAGFALLLMALGAFRELVGQASLAGFSFADSGFLLAILPPGAFFALALAVALKNRIDGKPGR